MNQLIRIRSRFSFTLCRWILMLGVGLLIVQSGSRVAAQQRVTVIRGGTLIDGNGGAPLQNAVIVIEGNRIRTITSGQAAGVPAGAQEIDARGKYIVPGLWDTHTHYHEWFPELQINNGVTSVLSYGGGPWLNAVREGTEKRKVFGPRFFMTQGTMGGSYMIEDKAMIEAGQLKGREDSIRLVRERVQAGAKIIKVYTSTTVDQLKAITEEAHRSGLKVSGHIGISAKEAALAGIDNLAHATGMPIPDMLKPEDLDKLPDMRVFDTERLRVYFPKITRPWDRARELWGPNTDLTEYPLFIEDPRRIMAFGLMDRGLAQDLITLFVKEQVFIESCIGYMFRYVNDHVGEWREEERRLMGDPNLAYIPARYKMNILDYSLMDKFRPDELALMKKGYQNYLWFTKTFVDAGGKITTGMDTSSSYHATMVPGLSTPREMQILVDGGLTPMQAILAPTKWSAELLGQTKDLGTLEPGKLADLLILRRDPLQDIKAVRDIEMVMQDGESLRLGYHFDFTHPIPEPAERQLAYSDWTVSDIPTHIESLSPAVVVEGSAPITLTVRGKEFVTSSIVKFDDKVLLKTELVGPTELRATVPAELLRNVGTYKIRVVHRPPAWGETNAEFLIVKFK